MSEPETNKIEAVVLAGELKDKFNSNTPHLLHTLTGQPVIHFAVNSVREAVGDLPLLVLSDDSEEINRQTEGLIKEIIYVEQGNDAFMLGKIAGLLTGDTAVILIVPANMPLLTSNTLEQLISTHLSNTGSSIPISILTYLSSTEDGNNYVVRDEFGAITNVSHSPKINSKLSNYELDTGVYCISSEWLMQVISRIHDSQSNEFHLNDLIEFAKADDLTVQDVQLINQEEALRIETRFHLAEAERIIRQRVLRNLMIAGVTIIDPNTTYIDAQVEIGSDTVIHPNTYLYGSTKIGTQCSIGPNCLIKDTSVGDRCEITFSVAESAMLEDDVDIGPFAHLRKGAHLARGVHMGNYGEVKNSYLGPGTKMGHFSYIGDATIGPGVNIGAGVITANYDGKNKHATEIGAGAFIGSDSMLVAPVKIGAGARTGAGSVVTKDVPPNSLAVGIPARVIRKVEEKDGS